jgi:[ribosomal protein S18]-alanine N-acetyltransferase
MAFTLRDYDPRDFPALHRLDQACFPAGISYSRTTLHYFLAAASADCVVAEVESAVPVKAAGAKEAAPGKMAHKIIGFIVSEENPPLAHIITLDVAESQRRQGVGTALLGALEANLGARGVRSILLETAIDNEGAVAFWKGHGYGIEAVLKQYYLARVDAYEMRKVLQSAEAVKRAAQADSPG